MSEDVRAENVHLDEHAEAGVRWLQLGLWTMLIVQVLAPLMTLYEKIGTTPVEGVSDQLLEAAGWVSFLGTNLALVFWGIGGLYLYLSASAAGLRMLQVLQIFLIGTTLMGLLPLLVEVSEVKLTTMRLGLTLLLYTILSDIGEFGDSIFGWKIPKSGVFRVMISFLGIIKVFYMLFAAWFKPSLAEEGHETKENNVVCSVGMDCLALAYLLMAIDQPVAGAIMFVVGPAYLWRYAWLMSSCTGDKIFSVWERVNRDFTTFGAKYLFLTVLNVVLLATL